ncbi:hypothetical protein N0M98_13870 [Paenibacillus doosanensis]|uniref:hypothetical protein n=1 Tax=Paenibacillus doosanensis TaxID=1229154 RepID=UPI00217FE73B|nr:hypothetical protein [Paenibacillus doosanensis]MCS7461233.1 hypothetical protein [Paenibacillus doosanensis]
MSYQRPIIGNQGASTRSLQQAPPFSGGGQFPAQYPGMEVSSFAQSPVPVQPSGGGGGGGGGLSSLLNGLGGGGGGGGSFNIGQIKQLIDRMGGIEGILDTMSKVQRMVQSVQQAAPLVKMLMGSLLKKKDGEADAAPKRRRRRRRKAGGAHKTKVKRRTRR